ncbi:MAG TPA: hypothetical protein VFR30_05300, partial [Lysobacter sp.]|nr:hypothetical protein [Lysobacter sp.]
EWLQALGHEVLMPLPAGSMAGASEPGGDRARTAAPHAVERDASKTGAPARPSSPGLPLLRALARAAARSEQDAEFLQVLPDVASLRGNPAARRALWPRLRALRKRTAQ